MNRITNKTRLAGLMCVLGLAATTLGDDFDLTWFTVDGGGETFSTGGNYTLGGAIGQPDAGPGSQGMTGGNYTLIGGFWAGAVTPFEVAGFFSCMVHGAGGPFETELCLDLFASNGVEPRIDGPSVLVFDTNFEIDPGTVSAENVQMACVNQVPPGWNVMLDGASTLVVELTEPLANLDCCTLTFNGVTSTAGEPLADALELVPLRGDVNFTGDVTGADFSLIKPHFGEIAGVDLSSPKWDYNLSGDVTGGDAALIKPLFGDIAPACP